MRERVFETRIDMEGGQEDSGHRIGNGRVEVWT